MSRDHFLQSAKTRFRVLIYFSLPPWVAIRWFHLFSIEYQVYEYEKTLTGLSTDLRRVSIRNFRCNLCSLPEIRLSGWAFVSSELRIFPKGGNYCKSSVAFVYWILYAKKVTSPNATQAGSEKETNTYRNRVFALRKKVISAHFGLGAAILLFYMVMWRNFPTL